MKQIIVVVVTLLLTTSVFAAPTEKVLKSFNSLFPAAENIVWSQDPDAHVVYFKKGSEQFRLWYNHDGIIFRSIRYYGKELLPPLIRSRIEGKYNGKEVHGITEVTGDEGLTYLIVLYDDQKWYHIKSDATGNCSIDKSYKKA